VCVTVVGVLFIAFFGALWARDRERRQICKAADAFMRASDVSSEWAATYDKVLFSSAQSKRIGLVGSNANRLPDVLQAKYRRYRLIRLLPVAFFAAIVLAGIVSRWVCP
jgi:hypothetical protein